MGEGPTSLSGNLPGVVGLVFPVVCISAPFIMLFWFCLCFSGAPEGCCARLSEVGLPRSLGAGCQKQQWEPSERVWASTVVSVCLSLWS